MPFGADVKYIYSVTDDDGVTEEQLYHVKVGRPVHDDLRRLFDADIASVASGVIGARVFPTAVSVSGHGDRTGIRISGDVNTAFGPAPVKTPRINFREGTTETDAELTVLFGKLVAEVYAYLYDGKQEELEEFNG